jgi:hypothetical protein
LRRQCEHNAAALLERDVMELILAQQQVALMVPALLMAVFSRVDKRQHDIASGGAQPLTHLSPCARPLIACPPRFLLRAGTALLALAALAALVSVFTFYAIYFMTSKEVRT